MVVRLKEWIIPYTAWDWIDISDNHVISVLLREANNLIHINEDREMYVDLQLDDGIEPTDDFPVWVTTGRILAEDWWDQNWIILNWKTTSGDYVRLIYAADWKLYYDPGTGVWNEIWGWGGGGTCDCNVKLFTLSGATDLTTAQAILDWQKAWKDAIIAYDGEIYMFKEYRVVTNTPAVWLSYNHIVRDWLSDGYSETYANAIEVNYNTSNDTVTSISFATYKTTPSAIDPDTYYASPFMPTQPYHPASKAYVDQMVSWVYIYKGSVATYSDLANIQNPEVWDVYNVVDSGMNYAWTGTAWDALWGTINYTAWDWIWINNWVISNTKPGATVSPTAPSNPSEWDLWYDTTNDVLKSYDGSSWNECGGDDWSNVKAFFISSTSDLTNAQAAYDWYAAGKEPILIYNNKAYLYDWLHNWGPSIKFLTNQLDLTTMSNSSAIAQSSVTLTVSSSTVTAISEGSYNRGYVLLTGVDYQSAYTPTYDWSPTSKKYVDGKDTYIGSSAPSTPYEWQLWYDTTNDVVKAYDGTNWNTIWSWGWGGTGDVVGPSSAVDWHLAVFDGTTWKLIKDWGAIPSYGAATSSAAWLVKLGSDTQQSVSANSPSSTNWRTYPIQTNSSWQMVVNVPWTDSWGWWGTTYTAWDWINISAQDVISNTMYPTNQSTGNVGDVLTKSANGTVWLDSSLLYNVKAWNVYSASSSTLEAIITWVNKGSDYSAILKLGENTYIYGSSSTSGSTTTYIFPSVEKKKNADSTWGPATGYTTIYQWAYKIEVTGSTYTGTVVNDWSNLANVIEPTGVPYAGYFTPTADYHPATKKYVDDAISWGGGGIICDPSSPITITKIWAWTESQYQNLGSYDNSTAYLTI